VSNIRALAEKVLKKRKEDRTVMELSFIAFILERFMFRSKFLSGWEDHKVLELCRYLRWRRVPAMTPIFMQGSKGHEAFLVLKGTVRFLHSSNDERGEPYLRKVCDGIPGDSFGELALLGLNQRKNMVLAVTWVELITISESDFKAASKAAIPSHLRASIENEVTGAQSTPMTSRKSLKPRQTIISGVSATTNKLSGDRPHMYEHGKLCVSDCDLLRGELSTLSSEQKLDFIQNVEAFKKLNPYMQFHIASKLVYKFYPKGALIHKQGFKADCLTFLYKGDVALVKSSSAKKKDAQDLKRRLHMTRLQKRRCNSSTGHNYSMETHFALSDKDSQYKCRVLDRQHIGKSLQSQMFGQGLAISSSESALRSVYSAPESRRCKTIHDNVRGITTSQRFNTDDGIRKSGVTVAHLAESVCFGESGVLSCILGVGSRHRIVERHNSVAVTPCHILILQQDNYKKLGSSTIEYLEEQMVCRQNWEYARGRTIVDKLNEKKKEEKRVSTDAIFFPTSSSFLAGEVISRPNFLLESHQHAFSGYQVTPETEAIASSTHIDRELCSAESSGGGDPQWQISSELFGSNPLPVHLVPESNGDDSCLHTQRMNELQCSASVYMSDRKTIDRDAPQQKPTPPSVLSLDDTPKLNYSANNSEEYVLKETKPPSLKDTFSNEFTNKYSSNLKQVINHAHECHSIRPMRSFESVAQFPSHVQIKKNGKSFGGSKISISAIAHIHNDDPFSMAFEEKGMSVEHANAARTLYLGRKGQGKKKQAKKKPIIRPEVKIGPPITVVGVKP